LWGFGGNWVRLVAARQRSRPGRIAKARHGYVDTKGSWRDERKTCAPDGRSCMSGKSRNAAAVLSAQDL
jgi:hypothetical protein